MRSAIVIEKANGNFSAYVPARLRGSRRHDRSGRGRNSRCDPLSYRGPARGRIAGPVPASIADYVEA